MAARERERARERARERERERAWMNWLANCPNVLEILADDKDDTHTQIF